VGPEIDAEMGPDSESNLTPPDELAKLFSVRNRMSYVPNVTPLSPPPTSQSTEQVFSTPRGMASVTHGLPKQPAMFYDEVSKRMLPKDEYFQLAANRQGANKYAKPKA